MIDSPNRFIIQIIIIIVLVKKAKITADVYVWILLSCCCISFQDIKSFNVMTPEQNLVLASVDFDRKATSTSIRDLCDNTNYVVKYEGNEISVSINSNKTSKKNESNVIRTQFS